MQNPEITDYLKDIVEPRKQRMVSLIALIKTTCPDAGESMKYKMPMYTQGDGWVALTNQKNYLSLYTCGSENIDAFKKKHPHIKTGKGFINIKGCLKIRTISS